MMPQPRRQARCWETLDCFIFEAVTMSETVFSPSFKASKIASRVLSLKPLKNLAFRSRYMSSANVTLLSRLCQIITTSYYDILICCARYGNSTLGMLKWTVEICEVQERSLMQ